MANTIAAISELSADVWGEPDGPYTGHTTPHGVGTGNVDHLIWSLAERGAGYVPDGLTVAQERCNILQAAAYADAVALNARDHSDKRVTGRVRMRAEQFAGMLREFDAAHGTWSGAISPDDAYFVREIGAEREFVRQEWDAHTNHEFCR